MTYVCEDEPCAGCECGICSRRNCLCACHELDSLSIDKIKDVLSTYFDHVDVSNLTRNACFGLMATSPQKAKIFKRCCKVLDSLLYGLHNDDEMIRRAAEMQSKLVDDGRNSPNCVMSSSLAAAKKTVAKKKNTAAVKKKKKITKTSAQKKRERALERCAT